MMDNSKYAIGDTVEITDRIWLAKNGIKRRYGIIKNVIWLASFDMPIYYVLVTLRCGAENISVFTEDELVKVEAFDI